MIESFLLIFFYTVRIDTLMIKDFFVFAQGETSIIIIFAFLIEAHVLLF